jgi:hypothetical protein
MTFMPVDPKGIEWTPTLRRRLHKAIKKSDAIAMRQAAARPKRNSPPIPQTPYALNFTCACLAGGRLRAIPVSQKNAARHPLFRTGLGYSAA